MNLQQMGVHINLTNVAMCNSAGGVKVEKPVLLTGDRPSGCLHLGHYVGSLVSRLELQKTHQPYIMVADVQALTDNFENPSKVQAHVFDVVKDYLAVGLDPEHCSFFVQSAIPEIAELAVYYLNLVTVARLERNPTVKNEMQQKDMNTSVPAGFLCYPVHQAADITITQADVVPVGDDQLPMIEQTNEIVRRFNRIYDTNVLKEVKPILSKTPRLVGIDGQAKASKSLGNAIFLSDTAEQVKEKVFQMFTDPDHLRVSDPGKVEGNVVFAYLDAFHPNSDEVQGLKEHYQRGGLGDMVLKRTLLEVLENLLAPIREKRNLIKDTEVEGILQQGTTVVRNKAKDVMNMVREVMFLNKWQLSK